MHLPDLIIQHNLHWI